MKPDYRKKALCFIGAWIFLFLCAQSGLAVKAAKSTSANDDKGQASIRVSETTYDFGEVQEGSEIEHDFVVRNTGQVALAIEGVRVG